MVAVEYDTIVDENGVPWIGGHDAARHLGVTTQHLRLLALQKTARVPKHF